MAPLKTIHTGAHLGDPVFEANSQPRPASKLRHLAQRAFFAFVAAVVLMAGGCHSTVRDPRTVVFLIESSPSNLDPRIGTDAQSEHIDELIFDGLVARDSRFSFTPALAERWEQPDGTDDCFSSAHRSSQFTMGAPARRVT